MSWRNIKLIFLREVRDQLRDRRTLFMIAVLPVLLYPGLGIGSLYMTQLFSEQSRTVVVLGSNELPSDPPLFEQDQFSAEWFKLPAHVDTLEIIADGFASDADKDPEELARRRFLLGSGERLRKPIIELNDRLLHKVYLEMIDNEASKDELVGLEQRIEELKSQAAELFADSGIEVLIIVPEGFAANINEMNRAISGRLSGVEDYTRPVIVRNSASDKSRLAFTRSMEAIKEWETELLGQRLKAAELPPSLPKPIGAAEIDLALDTQRSANLWSKLFPALLIIMTVTGAFYPAIDIGAGEKERGTMETLLICPATRTEIVLGKFFTVMVFSMATAMLNLLSMGMTGGHIRSMAGEALQRLGDMSVPPVSSLLWMIILLVPLAAFFSALCLALATFARSSKEGQYYLSPLLMVTLGLTVFCLSPAVEISPENPGSWFFSVMPVMGPALLLKGMLLAQHAAGELYVYAIPVLVTSIGYSLVALWWAIDQFSREAVLFREAEQFELKLWLRHMLRAKESLPSSMEAGFCFILIMLLQFGAMRFLASNGGIPDGLSTMKLLIIQQLVTIGLPAALMALFLTTSARKTLRLKRPSMRMMGIAVVLPVMLHPISIELQSSLSWFFPKLPDSVLRVIASMSDDNLSLPFVLLSFAVVPAVCEELAYRGFILSGFGRGGRTGLAIGLSSLTFGMMHMIPQQVFNASLLGLVLGALAVSSRSLFTCITFHMVFNALAVMHSRAAGWFEPTGILSWFFRIEDGQLRYQIATISITAVVAIWFLNRVAGAGRQKAADQSSNPMGIGPNSPVRVV